MVTYANNNSWEPYMLALGQLLRTIIDNFQSQASAGGFKNGTTYRIQQPLEEKDFDEDEIYL